MQSTSSPPQLNPPPTIMSRICTKVILNCGNAATKIAIHGGDTIVSDRGLIFNPDPLDGPAFTVDARGGARGENRPPWRMARGGKRPYHLPNGDGKAEYALPILIGELWPQLEEDNEIELYVLCHDPAKLSAGIRANLEGVFTVAFDGVRKRVSIKVLGVAREGFGLKSAIGETGTVITVDGGGGTIILTRHEFGQVPRKGGVVVMDDWGMGGLIAYLKNHNYDNWLGNRPTPASIHAYLSKPPKSASPHYQATVDGYVDELMAAIADQSFSLSEGVDRVLLIGGMAGIKAWRESFKRLGLPGLSVAKNPQTADVDGVLISKFG